MSRYLDVKQMTQMSVPNKCHTMTWTFANKFSLQELRTSLTGRTAEEAVADDNKASRSSSRRATGWSPAGWWSGY